MIEKGYRTWINTETSKTLEIRASRIDTVNSNVCIGGVKRGVCVWQCITENGVSSCYSN